jgi:hypothetical protein
VRACLLLFLPDDHLPVVRAARKAFVSQMETMMLEVAWRPFRHVCENFPREKGHMDCTGGKFYIWVSKNGLFAPFIYHKCEHFTKTGSGQT